MVVQAPHCVLDPVQRSVSSSGPLQVKSVNGQFFLEGEGFLIVDANPLSVAEKISLFGDAAIIVSAHSAGLTHALFAPASAVVVEAIDPFHLMGGLYYQMAAALGQDYWYLFAENQAWKSAKPRDDFRENPNWPFQMQTNGVSRKGYDDLSIPIDTLLRTIEAAETAGLRSEPPAVAGG